VSLSIGRQRQLYPDEPLPKAADASFDGYCTRLSGLLGKERYALTINSMHSYSWDFWLRERAFFAPLWAHVGRPLTGAITTLFHGNYEHTPVGVHQDRFATFMFALRGRKRMRFWTSAPWRDPVTSIVDYDRYLADSFVADVEPGDLLYWPSAYFHVGENVSDVAATSVNVGVPIVGHLAEYDLSRLLIDFDEGAHFVELSQHPGRGLPAVASPVLVRNAQRDGLLAAGLPPALREALRTLRERTAPARLRDRLEQVSLKGSTAGGFEPAPALTRRRQLTDDAQIRGDPAFPIRWTVSSCGSYCAANGRLFHSALAAKRLEQLVPRLNSGHVLEVGPLLRPFRRGQADFRGTALPATREGVRRLLQGLESCGGVRRV
jgi:hypothetical protein